MKPEKLKLKIKGFGYKKGSGMEEQDIDHALKPEDNPVAEWGRLITTELASHLIKDNYWTYLDKEYKHAKSTHNQKEMDRLNNTVVAVAFNKRDLLLALNQTDCCGIRCYFCRLDDKTQSIVISGVDGKGNDLESGNNFTIADGPFEKPQPSILLEVAGPTLFGQVKKDIQNSLY